MQLSARALALSIFVCLLVAAPASAGQIVYSSNDSILVANDDGSGVRTLVTPAQVPGATSLYNVFVDPNGTKVVFSARTPFTGGIFCGFNCVGVYTWDAGQISRVSGAPIGCAGDPCLGLDVDPRITADGNRVFYERVYGEPGGSYGTPQTISNSYVAPAVANGSSQETELSKEAVGAECGRPNGFVPSPTADEYTYVDCWPLSAPDPKPSSALKIRNGQGGIETIGGDDYYELSGIAWRPDGQELVDVESGNEKGIWLYSRTAGPDPRHVLEIADWDSNNYQSGVNPTYVGNDKLAFYWNGEIRTVPTSCNKCTLDQSTPLLASPDGDGLAWTSRALPTETAGGPNGNGNGNGNNGGGGMMMGGGFTAYTPAKIKLAAALKGLPIPFKTDRAGTLTLKAQIDAKTAKKYKLGKKAVSVASGTAKPKGAGESTVKLRFTKAAAKRLKKAKSVKLKLTGTWTPAGGSPQKLSASLTLKR
jgi:hypothetical protein